MIDLQALLLDELFRLLDGTESPDDCYAILKRAWDEGASSTDAALRQRVEELEKQVNYFTGVGIDSSTELYALRAQLAQAQSCEWVEVDGKLIFTPKTELAKQLAQMTTERDALQIPICIGQSVIDILAGEGCYKTSDGRSILAASDLFQEWRHERANLQQALNDARATNENMKLDTGLDVQRMEQATVLIETLQHQLAEAQARIKELEGR